MGVAGTCTTCCLLVFGHLSWMLFAILCKQVNLQEQPTIVSSIKISGSWYQSTDSPKDEEHHQEDDDSDEDDEDDDKERTNSVVVAAIPVVLGVLAIVLLCVFMMCRRSNQSRQQAKWSVRQHRASLRAISDDPERLGHSPYETINYVTTSPPIPETTTPSAPPDVTSDLPPSYEEVMRDVSQRQPNCNNSTAT